MAEPRNVKITVMAGPSLVAKLDAYAQRARWSRSMAAEFLIDEGLIEDEHDQQEAEKS